MKTDNKKYTFWGTCLVMLVAMPALLTSCISPAAREAQNFCNCLDRSLNSSNVIEGGIIYAGCKQMYQGSLQRLAATDTTVFKDVADSYEAYFWIQAAAKGINAFAEPTTDETPAPMN